MLLRSRSIAVLTAVLSLSSVAGASAAATSHASAKASSHAVSAKAVAVAKTKGATGVVKPVKAGGGAIAAISAFPAGGKGSGSEATCGLWSQRLQEDQQMVNDAPEADHDDASGPLNADIDNALDAGCAVLY
jgi:hypothetical protein